MSHRALAPLLSLLVACGGAAGSWSEAFDDPGAGSLSGVWGSADDDVWVVGGTDAGASLRHLVDGTWTTVDPPDVALLVWVHGFGRDDVWAVGRAGGMVHYDGSGWSVIDTPTDEDLWGVFGTAPDDLWIVGGAIDRGDPVLLHFDGSAFETVEVTGDLNPRQARALFKVWGTGDTLFAVGQRGLILQLQGGAWKAVSPGQGATDDWVSLWGTSADHVVAVGGRSNAQVGVWDGSAWRTLQPAGVPGLNAVWIGRETQAVVGGLGGWVGTFDPTTDTILAEAPATDVDVHAAWAATPAHVFAVGGSFSGAYAGAALERLEP